MQYPIRLAGREKGQEGEEELVVNVKSREKKTAGGETMRRNGV